MKRRINFFRLFLAMWLVFISLPVVFTGIQLATISDDVRHYNSQTIKSDHMTAMIEQEMNDRDNLVNSSHPVVAFMAQHTVVIWLPVFFLAGVAPIVKVCRIWQKIPPCH